MDRNTVVLASAGTGKTRKIVEYYVALLEDGADPLHIAALTFTEKAAGEMRERIRTAIYAKLENAEAPARSFWMRKLALLPAAPISTIHGFCGSLLREHGLHIGIDPSFSILDEQRSLDLARESAIETIRHEIRSGDAAAARIFGDFGLHALTDTIVRAVYWLNSIGKDAQWLERKVDEQEAAAALWRERFALEIAKYGGDPEKIGELADEVDARRTPRHPLRKRDEAQAILPRIGQIAGAPVARELSRLVSLSRERFRARKSAANALDFDDLLLGVRDLLNMPAVRSHYQERFGALLVDEFQDTDEIQAEIIQLLASDPADETRFASGKILIVGDPKQSIYRFRRARVTVFIRMIRKILDQGGVLERLQDNYRSAGPIVEFSNRLSEQMMDGVARCALPEYVDPAYRIRFSADDRMTPVSKQPFLGISYIAADAEARAGAGREMQAEAVARLLDGWKASGTIQSWREVAVLMRVMTNVDVIVDALEAHGIPVYVIKGSSFYQKSEVSDLIALLELVLRPEDPLLRAIVLSSSLFGASFKDLLEAATPRTLDEILQPWILQRDRATAAEILQDVILRTNFDVVLMAQKNGPQRAANVGKLIEITRDLAREGATALDEIVRRLRDRAQDTTVREPEAQIVGQDDEVVRVLTVHQAKGLEFDIVVVPDLAAKPRGSSSDRAVFSDRWGILASASYGLHRKPLPHSLILEAKEEDEDQQYEEEKRLLYVAITRARKMLVLGEGFAVRGGFWLEWVSQLIEGSQAGAIEGARTGNKVNVRFRGGGQDFTINMLPVTAFIQPQQLAFGMGVTTVNQEAYFEELERDCGARTLLPSLEMTPSDLGALHGCFRHFQWTRMLGISEPGTSPTGETGQMRRGSEAHKALEDNMSDPLELSAKGLEELEAVFASEQWLAIADLAERELPFMMHLAVAGKDCFVRGRMDAVVPSDPPRIIDYKFALWKDGAENVYQIQMAAYCLAVMKSIKADRAMAELWYLKSPMKIVQKAYTLTEAEQILSKLLGRYVAALESNVWPMAERAYCDRTECGFRSECWI